MISRVVRSFCSQSNIDVKPVSALIHDLIEDVGKLEVVSSRCLADAKVADRLDSILWRKQDIGSRVFSLLSFIKKARSPTTAWKLLTVLEVEIPSSSPDQLSDAAWCLAKLAIPDSQIWTLIRERIISTRPKDDNPKATSKALWGISNSNVIFNDLEKLSLKQWFSHASLDSFTSQDLVMILGSLCKLCPKDTPLITAISERLSSQNSTQSLPTCAIVSLWRSAECMQPAPAVLLEFLAEQSRSLRFDPNGFNDDACAQVAKAAATIKCTDPRVLYQLIHFMKVHGLKTRSKQFLTLIRSYTKLGIDDDVVWKRFSARIEQLGPGWNYKELRTVEKCFHKADKMNARVNGILQCFFAVKEDYDKYGPS